MRTIGKGNEWETGSKVDDDEYVTVEIAKDIKVKVRRDLISSVVSKSKSTKVENSNNKEKQNDGGILNNLFGSRPNQKGDEASLKSSKKNNKGKK